jgi:hypothetical protein
MKFVLSDNLYQSEPAKGIGNRCYTNKQSPPSRTNVNSVAFKPGLAGFVCVDAVKTAFWRMVQVMSFILQSSYFNLHTSTFNLY